MNVGTCRSLKLLEIYEPMSTLSMPAGGARSHDIVFLSKMKKDRSSLTIVGRK